MKSNPKFKAKLLVDAKTFYCELKLMLLSARKSIDIKMMTFEGDEVGCRIAAILAKKAEEGIRARVFIDYFTSFMISDKFVPKAYLFSKEIRDEVKATKQMMDFMKRAGVVVKRTVFDHRKVVMVDNCKSLVGGFNFSEHNFLWHDLAVKIEGKYDSISKKDILLVIRKAQKEICVESPYIAGRFIKELHKASKRGVSVKIIVPRYNNLPFFSSLHKYYARRFSSGNMGFHYFDGMTHVKTMVIDDKVITGSFNFNGFWLKENCVIIKDKSFAKEVKGVLMQNLA